MSNQITAVFIFCIFVTLFVLLFLPGNSEKCTGWCCNESNSLTDSVYDSNLLIPFNPRESDFSLIDYCTEENGKLSGTDTAVNILENFVPGIFTVNIKHNPIQEICKLVAQRTPETMNSDKGNFIHKNNYHLVGISGKKGSAFEIFATAYVSQAFLKPKGIIIINGMVNNNCPAFQAWNQLVSAKVVHWHSQDLFTFEDEIWVKGVLQSDRSSKCMSEYMSEIIYKYLDSSLFNIAMFHRNSNRIRYYVTTMERELEIFRAYKNDHTYIVDSVTSGIHACVLKSLFPKMQIQFKEGSHRTEEEKQFYPKILQFINTYISM